MVQFATQIWFNAFADSEAGGPPVWDGINALGRELIAEAVPKVADHNWLRLFDAVLAS